MPDQVVSELCCWRTLGFTSIRKPNVVDVHISKLRQNRCGVRTPAAAHGAQRGVYGHGSRVGVPPVTSMVSIIGGDPGVGYIALDWCPGAVLPRPCGMRAGTIREGARKY